MSVCVGVGWDGGGGLHLSLSSTTQLPAAQATFQKRLDETLHANMIKTKQIALVGDERNTLV